MSNIKSKSSQAAMEFLMTYGWAILVVLVAIGALAYFGVLNPDRFLPSKCTLQSGIACVDHKVEAAAGTGGVGLVTVRVTNSLGYDIDTINVRAGDCGNSVSNCFGSCPTTLANGVSQTYQINCAAALSGSKFNEQLNVTYRNVDTTISHNNVGQLIARIE
jgi:hypothetical protein